MQAVWRLFVLFPSCVCRSPKSEWFCGMGNLGAEACHFKDASTRTYIYLICVRACFDFYGVAGNVELQQRHVVARDVHVRAICALLSGIQQATQTGSIRTGDWRWRLRMLVQPHVGSAFKSRAYAHGSRAHHCHLPMACEATFQMQVHCICK